MRISIIGDSISSYAGTSPDDYPYRYPREDIQSINEIWWEIVCRELHAVPTNCSWSASRATYRTQSDMETAYAGCSDTRISDVGRDGTPDKIFCYIGCNDWGNEIDLGEWSSGDDPIDDFEHNRHFSNAYALMIKKLKTAYPTSEIYCFTVLEDRKRDETPGTAPSVNANGVTIPQWNNRIKEIAQDMNVNVIDLHECIAYADIGTYTQDGLHPNADGMELMAEYVINTLTNNN